MPQLAVDISNWQGDLDANVYQRWYREGARTVICGTDGSATHPVVFPSQMQKARAAGLNVEAYIYLYFSLDVVRRTNLKLDMIDAIGGVPRVWIDCEDTTSGRPPSELVGLIAAARDQVQARGYECGIYTGRWWWEPYTNNERGFGDLPLWNASYDGVLTLDTRPMGGWTELYRKQFTDKGTLGGISPLDLNVERESVAPPAQPPADDFQRGKREGRAEMFFEGWQRDSGPVLRETARILIEHADWIDRRPDEWGIER